MPLGGFRLWPLSPVLSQIWSQNFAEMCEIDFYEKLTNFRH